MEKDEKKENPSDDDSKVSIIEQALLNNVGRASGGDYPTEPWDTCREPASDDGSCEHDLCYTWDDPFGDDTWS